ncbi:MAG: hypothetical protein AAGU78_11030 [Chloroflexota bacterium]|nr:hypothetical protein [Anaerolineae bacterium]HMM28345.1 hypothetical protein [Aggregatilineaceae bacterium]
MKKSLFPALALVIIVFAGMAAQPAQALTVTGLTIEFDCTSMTVTAPYTLSYDRDTTGSGAEQILIIVSDGKGKPLYSESGALPTGAAFSSPGGFSLPYFDAPDYNPIIMRVTSPAGNGQPEQVALVLTGECEGLPWATGPTYPAGYVQRTILCDVPVYNTPGGAPVGGNALKAGQSWHVNPTPVDGPDGQQWTEVFAGGYQRPFIPTACVGG